MVDRKLESKLGFETVRSIVSGYCITDYAVARAAEEEFICDPSAIRERLLLTDEMRLILMFEDSYPTSGYIDALPFLRPLEKDGTYIDVLSMGKLKTLLDTTKRIANFFASVKDGVYPNLSRMASRMIVYPEVIRRIESILDKYGDIKDSASDTLFSIRRSLRDKEAAISKRAAAVLKEAQQSGIVEEGATVTIRDGKYLIPVAASDKRKLRGFVFDESSTGRTVFIEPAEIIELENDIAELRFDEMREIEIILRNFTDFLRPYVPDICAGAEKIGELDFIMAKARTALDMVAGMPVISDNGSLNLRKARHPLLERALRKEGREIVPLTVNLTPEKHILLISGPNAGGKSVCLKTTGLLQYMFQWGMLIPTSESSELPVFDRILVSIGDNQSIEDDLSTYSSLLSDMKRMLGEADDRTLVLIDEFGSGTEPTAGGAIAEAILAELDRRGVYGVITTHYTNLKLYASGGDTGVINGAMLFDAAKIAPLFKLEAGIPGNSFAFELARKTGLPEAIVKDAEERAGQGFVGIERNLRRIARGRRTLDEKIQKVKHEGRQLEGLTDLYQKELEDIRDQKQKILSDARREAEDIVRGAGKQVERTIREIKESQADRERTKEARANLQNFMGALQQRKTREGYIEKKLDKLKKRQEGQGRNTDQQSQPRRQEPFKIGEKVRIIESGLPGEVCKVSPKSVTVAVGSITTIISPEKIERISAGEYREATRKDFKPVISRRDDAITERKLNFRTEIDLRGERLADALEKTMHYIDDATMLGVPGVRIIHGKGTGVLRVEIQKYLRTVPGIAEVKDEDVRNGGTGVTLVRFE